MPLAKFAFGGMSKSTTSPSSLLAQRRGELAADVSCSDEGDLLASGSCAGRSTTRGCRRNRDPCARSRGPWTAGALRARAWSTRATLTHRARRRRSTPRASTPRRKYEGKVRDNYTTADGRRFIVVTDRISAFDRVLGTLPLQGPDPEPAWPPSGSSKTRDVAPNHMIGVPDPNVLEAARVHAARRSRW